MFDIVLVRLLVILGTGSTVCTMDGYISILLLIALASTCHGKDRCRDRCILECSREWEKLDGTNGGCCEGRGSEQFLKFPMSIYCRDGICDVPG